MSSYFLFVTLKLIITLCNAQFRAVKNITLTPNNPNADGAKIDIIHSDVTTSHSLWNIITTDEIGFHLHISLDQTWGLLSDETSSIDINITGDNTQLIDVPLIASFSDSNNTQYFTTIISMNNSNQNNKIYPNKDQPPINGNIESLMNDATTNESRIEKATNGGFTFPFPIDRPSKMMGNWNNSWPLSFQIKSYPTAKPLHFILDLYENNWPDHQHCRRNALFPNTGLNFYFAVANIGDTVNITSIGVSYKYNITYAPTVEPTLDPTFNPTTDTKEPTGNPTSDPTIHPTADPTANMVDYGVRITIIFRYDIIDNSSQSDIPSIVPAILEDIIDEQLMNDCHINGNYDVHLNANNTVIVNATVFVCDQTAQNTLTEFINDGNTLKTDFIISIKNETNNNILVPAQYFRPFAEPINPTELYVTPSPIYSVVNSTMNERISNEETYEFDVNLDVHIIFIILASIICIGVTVPLIDMIYIRRFDEYHIYNTLLYALSVCNLWTDILISYGLSMYYIRENNDTLILIIVIIANVSVGISYVYNKILGSIKVYIIPSHFCCLLSDLLVTISGDSYITLKLLTSNLFNTNTINYINKFEMKRAKIFTILCQNIPQIIVQSIFEILILKSMDLLLITSIILSVITMVPYLWFIVFYMKCKQLIHIEYVLHIKIGKIPQNKNNASNNHLLSNKLSCILGINSSEMQIESILSSKIRIIHEIDKKHRIDMDKYIKKLYENNWDEINEAIKNIYNLNANIETELDLDDNINVNNNNNNYGVMSKHMELASIEYESGTSNKMNESINLHESTMTDNENINNMISPPTPISPDENDFILENIYIKVINENEQMEASDDKTNSNDNNDTDAENDDLWNYENKERKITKEGDEIYTAIGCDGIDIGNKTEPELPAEPGDVNDNDSDNDMYGIDAPNQLLVTNAGENNLINSDGNTPKTPQRENGDENGNV